MNEKFKSLNDVQFEAVTATEGPLLILAGAGSGKTRVLTYRTAYLIEECGVSPYQIIALTFTNKAANEMKERIASIVGEGAENIWVSTFHSSCVKILRRFIEALGYERNFTIYDTDDQKALMRDICKFLNIDTKKYKEKTILSVISSAKDELISPKLFEAQHSADPVGRIYSMCYSEYQKRLAASNALDFDDLIFKTVELLRKDEQTAYYYRNRFRYIMVDEYQDTNTAQFELIKLLAQHRGEDGSIEHNLCVVGDDDQSIYKFRGANIHNILDFEDTYPEARVIRLEQNYRSTKSILDAANDVIVNNKMRKAKKLWTQNPDGETVKLIKCANDIDEAQTVVNTIAREVRDSRDYKDFAILYRTNAQSRSFEEKLVRSNIPYRIIGGINFYQRKEIKDVLAYLRTIASGRDSVALRRIINVPKRGIGLATLDRVDAYCLERDISFYEGLISIRSIPDVSRAVAKVESFVAAIEVLKSNLSRGGALKNIINDVLETTGYLEYLDEEEDDEVKLEERKENINELISKLAIYEEACNANGEEATLEGFLDEVSLVADIDSYSEDNNCVVLMTVHSAKGLEFPCVFMCGMEDGVFPGYMSINADNPEEEIAEERRLCYVGITRAKESLTLTAAKQRMIRGEISYNTISRFVKEIPRHLLKIEATEMAVDAGVGRKEKAPERIGTDKQGRFTPSGSGQGYHNGSIAQNTDRKPGKKPSAGFFSMPGIMKGASFSASSVDYAVGDMVKHIKFGVGKVLEMEKSGDDYRVTVDFPGGQRKVMASFAKLVKV